MGSLYRATRLKIRLEKLQLFKTQAELLLKVSGLVLSKGCQTAPAFWGPVPRQHIPVICSSDGLLLAVSYYLSQSCFDGK